jgi:putative chitinase
MPYEIKNGNIVAKGTNGSKKSFNKQAVDAIIGECKRRGVTNKYIIAGILATVSKESGFVPQNENLNYSAEGLKKIFPSYFGGKNTKPGTSAGDYAKKPEKIANYVYGPPRGGHKNPGDGWKYRGRGFNQITFKGSYEKYGKNIPGLVENPDLLNQVGPAAVSCVAFYVEGDFKSTKSIKSKFGKSSVNDFNDWNQALLCIINMTAGFGNGKTDYVVTSNYDKAKICHGFLIEYLEKNPQGTTAPPPDNTSNVDNKAQDQQNQDQAAQQTNDTQQSDTSSDSGSSNNSTNNGQPIKNLTQLFAPSISPKELSFDSGETGKNDKQKVSKQLGYMPFIWYNGFQIAYQDISKFSLYHKGMLPSVEMTFFDTLGVLREDGFPHDDTIITIYLNSKSLNLRSIHMDFKILDFKDNGSNSYTIVGICDIPQIYLKKFSSYNGKTSHEALQEVAKQVGIGFCSNIQNSDDKMTWINTGFKIIEFIENIIGNSYVSETSFQYCYVDFYYNLCYMDLNKEMERDVTNDRQVVGFGYKFLDGKEENPDTDEETIDLILTNEKTAKESIAFFSTFELVNKSTRISLDKSYRTRSKFYDTISKELLVFDVESQTSDGSKSIILKGASNDDKFFQDNTSNIWIGKQDMYDDGKGNVHKNYNYSVSQNRINLDDITKISCKLHLPNNNYNLYIYQKIPIYFMPQKETPTIKNSVYKRISGDWLITNIEFEFEGGKSHQVVTAVKRELSILPEEQGESKPRSNSNVNNNENNTNELSPNDQAAPEPTPNQPAQPTVQPQSTPSVIDRETASQYKLDYILGAEAFKDNDKKVRKLVLIDGEPVDEVVAVAYLKMQEAAKKEGINIKINSGFRPAYGPNLKAKTEKGKTLTITTQESLRRDKGRWVKSSRGRFATDDDFVFNAKSSAYSPKTAPPGKSNHGNGIALDLNAGSRIEFNRILNNSIYKWLVNNSWKFGFVRAVTTEEWHFEYRPEKSKLGPYAVVKDSEVNLFYSDLGLNNIKIA